jgi:hypothetical protein
MIYSILLTVKKPEQTENWKTDNKLNAEYAALLRTLQQVSKRNEDVKLLTESSVLLPLNHGLKDVAEVVTCLGSLPYSYTILTEDTKWIEVPNKDQTVIS